MIEKESIEHLLRVANMNLFVVDAVEGMRSGTCFGSHGKNSISTIDIVQWNRDPYYHTLYFQALEELVHMNVIKRTEVENYGLLRVPIIVWSLVDEA